MKWYKQFKWYKISGTTFIRYKHELNSSSPPVQLTIYNSSHNEDLVKENEGLILLKD